MEEKYKKQEEILERYRMGLASEEEIAFVEHAYNQQAEKLSDELADPDYEKVQKEIWDRLSGIQEINSENPILGKRTSYNTWRRISVAASILIAFSIGGWLMTSEPSKEIEQTKIVKIKDVEPGKNSATLTLSDGRVVMLSDAEEGVVNEESLISISKSTDGELIYTLKGSTASDEIKLNTLTTLKGEQYRLVLADGSKVWLNAASSITFPENFSAKNARSVNLIGEAYFEVAPRSAEEPFIVTSANQEVHVLGTHFNVSAYPEERRTKTTLVEGSVKVTSITNNQLSSIKSILKPSQQSTIVAGNPRINVKEINVESVISWKNGYYIFESEELGSIMQKIGHWYNLEVVFRGNVSSLRFGGRVSRKDNVSKILEIMQETGNVRFEIEETAQGNRIIVMPSKL